MSVFIACTADADQQVWFSNSSFRELTARVAQHPQAGQDVRHQFALAEAFGGLRLAELSSETQARIAPILRETAREMAAELDRPSEDPHNAAFAARLHELERLLQSTYGPGGNEPGKPSTREET